MFTISISISHTWIIRFFFPNFFLNKILQPRIEMKFQWRWTNMTAFHQKMFKILTSMDERSSRKRIGSVLEMDIHMYVHAGKLFRECTFTFAIFSSLSLFLSLPLFLNLFWLKVKKKERKFIRSVLSWIRRNWD